MLVYTYMLREAVGSGSESSSFGFLVYDYMKVWDLEHREKEALIFKEVVSRNGSQCVSIQSSPQKYLKMP